MGLVRQGKRIMLAQEELAFADRWFDELWARARDSVDLPILSHHSIAVPRSCRAPFKPTFHTTEAPRTPLCERFSHIHRAAVQHIYEYRVRGSGRAPQPLHSINRHASA
jgi:hypothetical protein